MKEKSFILAIAVVPVLIFHIIVQAQTGSHIKEGGGKQPETVVWFSESWEITDIRLLLQAGKKELAVEKARAYVAGLMNLAGIEAEVRRYFGLSALCSALTSTGELEEAIQTCSDAIDIYPSRWQALNNRGVAYYLSGRIDLSLQDYQRALSEAQNSEPVSKLIQHNIDLVEARKQDQNRSR